MPEDVLISGAGNVDSYVLKQVFTSSFFYMDMPNIKRSALDLL
jgi:hypothetical protein